MNTIAVFCGSKHGATDCYVKEAQALGYELAKRNMTLVYGGSSLGIMGVTADSVLEAGGKAIGVMPNFLDTKERTHKNLSELHIVSSMHERKAMMADLADGFVVLPGGPGTLEEFFEVFTWGQLGLHHKPIGILNTDHYYDPLLALFTHMINAQFMDEKFQSMTLVESDPSDLLNQMQNYQPVHAKTYLNDDRT